MLNYPQTKNIKHDKFLENLVQTSLFALENMYIPEKKEFAQKIRLSDNNTYLMGKTSIRYTLINLIWLSKAKNYNLQFKFGLKDILLNQLNKADKYSGVGDLGLLLWAASLLAPEDITKLLTKVNFNKILDSYNDAKIELTMELSWLLTGLLMASTFNDKFKSSIGNLPEKVYNIIRSNYNGNGLFSHSGNKTLKGKIRGEIASFADQIYTIYAFSLFSRQIHNEEALLVAQECAEKICELQGDNGEWIWHYNSKNSKVVNRFPTFSVNQIALAPIALSSIQKASGKSFNSSIDKGINWFLNNSNNYNLINTDKNIIWDAVSPKVSRRKLDLTINLLGINSSTASEKIEVIKESSSYNYGWMLHAFSGKTSSKTKTNPENENQSNLFILK